MKVPSTLLSILLCIAVHAEQVKPEIKYGERPKNSIFDPTGVLTPQEQERISAPLQDILKNEAIDVLVVILPEIGNAPPEHVVKGFAEIWAKTSVNSVVLHVPGREGSPWIFPGDLMSRVVKPDAARQAIDQAEKRAAAEPTDFGKVRAASIEASDILRYWTGGALMRSERIMGERQKLRLAYEERQRLIKLLLALGAASLIPVFAGAFLVIARIRNSRPRNFPEIKVVNRLGAPYSGGNSAFTKHI
jgi:hypothetical protein